MITKDISGDNSMNNNKIITDAISKLSDKYKNNENDFFNEKDMHHLFFNIVYSNLKQLIHPEYITNKRFIRKKSKNEDYQKNKHSFEPNIKKGRRGHYDLVVISKDFYEKNKNDFNKVSNKTIGINSTEGCYIDIALEFKYFIDKIDLEEIKFDIFKLKEGNEINHKIMIIFIKKGVDFPDNIKRYIEDFADNKVKLYLI
jgi:hypothetical protein